MINTACVEGVVAYVPTTGISEDGNAWFCFYVRCERNHKMKNGVTVHDFIRVQAWNDVARACRTYIAAGKKVTVQGSVCSYVEEQKGKKFNRLYINLVAFSVDQARESWSIIPLQTVAVGGKNDEIGAQPDGLEGW